MVLRLFCERLCFCQPCQKTLQKGDLKLPRRTGCPPQISPCSALCGLHQLLLLLCEFLLRLLNILRLCSACLIPAALLHLLKNLKLIVGGCIHVALKHLTKCVAAPFADISATLP